MKTITTAALAGAAGLSLLAAAPTVHAQANVDLNTWSEVTADNNGNWDVDNNGVEGSGPNGEFVRQEVNGSPTIYLSPDSFINTTIEGSFQVDTSSDNDFIGFVFGLTSPTSSSSNYLDGLLLDWKQGAQSGADPGFRLSYVTGEIENSGSTSNRFWTHTSTADTTFQSLGTYTGAGRGWAHSTEYNFRLDYSDTDIEIFIEGGTGEYASETKIMDVNVNDAAAAAAFSSGAFPDGRFGFYNFSQAQVIYESFTRTDDPVLSTTPGDEQVLDFGNVRVTGTTQETLTVANNGGPGSTLTGTAPDPSDPAFTLDTADPDFTLGESEDTDFTYSFAPDSRGSFSEAVTVSSNDPADTDGHAVTLTGQGVGPVTDVADAVDLGDVDADSSTLVDLVIENVTPDGDLGDLTDLTLLDAQLSGDDADQFELVGFTPGQAVAAGGQLSLELRYLGDGELGSQMATLLLMTDQGAALGADGQDFTVDLLATAVPEPASAALLALGAGAMAIGRRRHAS